jgi:predicted molibdopterin-dependent oxidoreductase YjgC
MNVNSREGQLVHIGPMPGKRTAPPQLCLKGKFLTADLNHHPDRITTPLIKKEGRWIEADWKDAITHIATSLEGQKGDHFGLIASAQDTLEDNYLLQKFSRVVMHTNNVDLHHSYPDHKVPELLHWYHTHHPLMDLDLLDEADALLILGLDGSVSHSMLENRIRKSFGKGNQVIYASPRRTRTSTFTTREILYEPGEEYKLVYKLVTEEVPGILRSARKLVILVGDNLLRIDRSVEILRLLFDLNKFKQRDHQCFLLFPGMEGSVYGSLFMGAHPDYLPGFHSLRDKKNVANWNKRWNATLSPSEGWSRTQMIRQAGNKKLTSMMVIGDISADPNLANLELLIQCNMFKTGLWEYAHVFLPLCDFLENEGHTLSMDGKLRKLNKSLTKPGEAKSISGILADLSAAMGIQGWKNTPSDAFREIRSAISLLSAPLTKVETGIPSFGKGIPAKMEKELITDAFIHDHYHYRGIRLNALIPELNEIMESNKLSE